MCLWCVWAIALPPPPLNLPALPPLPLHPVRPGSHPSHAEPTATLVSRLCFAPPCNLLSATLNPSSPAAGWTDFMINLYVAGDSRRHVCEVQVAHASMLVARKGLPGHVVYGRVRNATEMNEFLGVDGEQGRAARLRELRAQRDPIASTAELLRLGCKPETLIASGCSQAELEQARCFCALVIRS